MSDEEKEILNNLKEYMQDSIDKGYHKFIYNDLGWDFKCIDCINAIDKVLKQSKELEDLKDIQQQICNEELFEKEYVEKLQKEIDNLKREVIHWQGNYHLLSRKIEVVSKDKIKVKTEELEPFKKVVPAENNYTYKELIEFGIDLLQELLEEKE